MGAITMGFSAWVAQSHQVGSQTRQALEEIRVSLDFVTRQLERAVPGSLVISPDGSEVEFLHSAYQGILDRVDGSQLSDGTVTSEGKARFRIFHLDSPATLVAHDYAFTGTPEYSASLTNPGLQFVAPEFCNAVISSVCAATVTAMEALHFSIEDSSFTPYGGMIYFLADYRARLQVREYGEGHGLFLDLCRSSHMFSNCWQNARAFLVVANVQDLRFRDHGAGRVEVRLTSSALPAAPQARLVVSP
ncbi:hypothetical protein [Desulfurispirillum indicum]|uniref:hypothetical protein n=1 Tax=Desulfurispirillum indicum TaxID=936456 RepID=UPI0021F56062|nr:hypothetical protein [Desulfurispirillum indicum]